MQSSLIPERPLIISPTLAATIGLEEAVLLHVLSELMAHRQCQARQGLKWLELDQQSLLDALPFWAWIDIKRVQKNLLDLGLILVDAQTGRQDSWLFAINQRGTAQAAPAAPAPATVKAPRGRNGQAGYIAEDWQPDSEWLAMCRQHGVPDEFSLSLVPGFVMYWRDRAQSRFSWGNAFYKHVLREWRNQQTRRGGSALDSPMGADWQPSDDAISILRRAGVSQAFIDDAVPEFVLYWRERGVQEGAWNTRFVEHIRRQWARFQVLGSQDGLPRPIPENWQPETGVFDILRLAEIDEDFARSRVPEFVLYWRDTGQAHASWNTRFLQYVKFAWARRPEALGTGLTGHHAQDQLPAERSRQGLEAALKRFTDRSWAE